MSNLLKETLEMLEWKGKTPADVLWVGSSDGVYAITWSEFEQLANIEYDFNYIYSQKIAKDLVIVGNNWWLTRSVFDGWEGWDFNTTPQIKEGKSFTRVTDPEGACWASVEEMNFPNGKYTYLYT